MQEFRNVESYRANIEIFCWDIKTRNSSVDNTKEINYYLVIDTLFNEAFSHWVFESAIWLPEYFKLKEQHPNLKVLLRQKRGFKTIFLDYLGIDYEFDNSLPYDVCHNVDYSFRNFVPENNICYFPKFVSLNQVEHVDLDFFSMQLDKFLNCLNIVGQEKTINTLLMPRQSKENFAANDRSIPIDNITGTILNTDEIKTIKDQIEMIQKSKNIILTYGSAFFVNGLFASNSNIIVLGDRFKHHELFPLLQFIYKKMCETNKVYILPFKNVYNQSDVENLLA